MILKAYLVAFFGGAISITSPCTFPLLPPLIAYLAVFAVDDIRNSRGRLFGRTVLRLFLLMAGVSLVFSMFANPTSVGGSFVHQYKEILVRAAGVIVVLLGIVKLASVSNFWANRPLVSSFQSLVSRRGRSLKAPVAAGWVTTVLVTGLVGATFGLAALPCCLGRIMSGILMTRVSANQSFLLFGYMLGLSIAFALIGGGALALIFWLSKSAEHHKFIAQASSILLIIMGILLISGVWSYYLFELAKYSATTKTLPVRLEEWLLGVFGMQS